MLKLLRENEFVRLFDLSGETFFLSKYRSCELPYRANFFIDRWRRADEPLHNDMIASLTGFPAALVEEADDIVRFLDSIDLNLARRARALITVEPDDVDVRHFMELFKAVLELGERAWTLVGETRYFFVLQSMMELKIALKPAYRESPPSDVELSALASSLPEGLFKWGVELVCLERRRHPGSRYWWP